MDKIHITLVDLGLLVIPLVGLLSLQKEAPKNRDTVAARKWIQLEKISLVVFFLLSVVALFLRLLFSEMWNSFHCFWGFVALLLLLAVLIIIAEKKRKSVGQ